VNQLATEKALEKSRKKSSATLRNVARNSVESYVANAQRPAFLRLDYFASIF